MDLYSPNLLHISVEELHVSHACRMEKIKIQMKERAKEMKHTQSLDGGWSNLRFLKIVESALVWLFSDCV